MEAVVNLKTTPGELDLIRDALASAGDEAMAYAADVKKDASLRRSMRELAAQYKFLVEKLSS